MNVDQIRAEARASVYTDERMARVRDRAAISDLEAKLRAETECVDPETLTSHDFCEGVYIRTLKIPKGFTVVGKIHRHACFNILLSGSIQIALTDGSSVTMTAPHVFKSEPGEKKAGFALEDTIWLNIHATEEKDLQKIEEQLIVPSFEALDAEEMLKMEQRG